MKAKHVLLVAVAAGIMATMSAPAVGAGKSEVIAKADLKWKDMGTPGVKAAVVSGERLNSPSSTAMS